MKFLIISNSAFSILNFRADLIKSILNLGWEVHVAAPKLDQDTHEYRELVLLGVVPHSIPLARVSINPVSDLKTLFALLSLCRTLRPECVLSYTIKPVIWGGIATNLVGIPRFYALITGLGYAFTDHQGFSLRRLITGVASKLLYRLALRKSSHVFFQNPDDKQIFEDARLVSSRVLSTVVKGSGVNLDYFKKTNLPETPVFLMVARLLVDKGVREYAAAAEVVKKKYPSAQFLLAGPLDENPESISRPELEQWRANGVLNYLGTLDDVRPAIVSSAVFVLPSYREGTPRSVLEAMAMGRPIITTDAPGCRETVKNSENGYLVPIKSSLALAEVMERFITNPRLIQLMGEQSYAIAVDDYDVQKVNLVMLNAMGLLVSS